VTLGFEAREGESPFTKPAGEACRHLCSAGCGIYAARPDACRSFQCVWHVRPSLGASLRPDRCGVLLAANQNPLAKGLAIFAYELRPGALEGKAVRRLVQELSQAHTVILVKEDGGRDVLTRDPSVARRLSRSA
jgi:hypothetical protein